MASINLQYDNKVFRDFDCWINQDKYVNVIKSWECVLSILITFRVTSFLMTRVLEIKESVILKRN